MLSVTGKRVCDDKIQFLCSDFIKNFVVGSCAGFNSQQRAYILKKLLQALCVSLRITEEEVYKDDTA